MAKLDIHGTLLEYTERGSGPPLVLIHGSASDCRTWTAQQAEFAAPYRVIAYSRRYHWPNEPIQGDADYSMSEHIEDLETLLHSLDAAPAHLVGHSYGAFLALLLAIRKPHLVRSLVLTEPPVVTLFVSNPPKAAEILKLLATRPRTALAILKFGAMGVGPATAAAKRGDPRTAMLIFGKAVLGPDAFGRLSESRLEQVQVNSFRAEFLGSGFVPLDANRIRGVETPTLLITGRRSPALFHRLADGLSELLPRVQRVEIDHASHIVHEDNPSAYGGAVSRFLEDQPA